MQVPRCYGVPVALLASLLTALAVRAGDIATPIEIPFVGRPDGLPFSEAAGHHFDPTASAEPMTVRAEQPITFTLQIQAEGRVYRPPQRLDLTQVPGVNDNFYIADPKQDSYDAATQTWQFVYTLKPRRTDVTEIPRVPFVYFNPEIESAEESKRFQTPYTDEIPLQVTAEEKVPTPATSVPPLFLQTQTGPDLLKRRAPWSPPSWFLLGALFVAPLLACYTWYIVWRWLYPDAVRLLKQRRSRAATLALKQLQHLPRGATEVRAAYIAAAVTAYFQQRLDLPTAEPTPAEAAAHLRKTGCPDALTKRAEQFFQMCDAVRFCPEEVEATLSASAQQLILDLEAYTWSSLPS
jgi:hypothetical protein